MANAFKLTRRDDVKETVKFVTNFDKFFDMLNVKNLINGKNKRKDFQLPYTSISDSRLNVRVLQQRDAFKQGFCIIAVAEGRLFEVY